MNLKALAISSTLSFGLIYIGVGAPAQAQVHQLSVSDVTGSNGAFPTIKLGVNKGVTIKVPTGTLIYKGWLDNDLILGDDKALDSDSPFENGASLIYVTPRNKGRAKLTLVTLDSNRQQSLYIIKVEIGASGPDLISIGGKNSVPKQSTNSSIKVKQPGDDSYTLALGLNEAVSQGKITQGSDLYQSILSVIRLVKTEGYSIETAANSVGEDPEVIQKIFRMGQGTDSPLIVPKPPPAPKRIPGNDLVQSIPEPPPLISAQPPLNVGTSEVRIPKEKKFKGSLASEPQSIQSLVSQKKRKIKPVKIPSLKEFKASRFKDTNKLDQFYLSGLYTNPPILKDEQSTKESSKSNTLISEGSKAKDKTIVVASAPAAVRPLTSFKPKLTTHRIANALVVSLIGAKITYQQKAKIQDAVYLLRKGKSYKDALQQARVPKTLADLLLKKVNVDPQEL